MDLSKSLLAVVVILFLGSSTVQSRKVLICGPDGASGRGWLTVKGVMDVHDESEQGPSRLWRNLKLPFRESIFQRISLKPRQTRINSQDSPALDGISQSLICSTCMDMTSRAQKFLTEPDLLDRILDYVNNTMCGQLMPGHEEVCVRLVKSYAPAMLEALQGYMTPRRLCIDTKLCPNDSLRPVANNQEKLIAELSNACSQIPERMDQCKEIVAQYIPFLVRNMDLFLDVNMPFSNKHAPKISFALDMNPDITIQNDDDTSFKGDGDSGYVGI